MEMFRGSGGHLVVVAAGDKKARVVGGEGGA